MVGDKIKYILEGYPPKYNQYVSDLLVKEINSAIEKAYSEKAKGADRMGSAIENAEIALLLCRSVLSVFPDNPQALKLIKDAQSIVEKVGAELDKKIYTSPLHKQNAGKILFSKSPIEVKKENPGSITNNFNANDNIYAITYFKGTEAELSGGAGYSKNGMITIFIDDNEKGTYEFTPTKEIEGSTCQELEIIPDLTTSKQPDGPVVYSKMLGEASPRNHTIKFRYSVVFSNYRYDLAEGSFDIDLSQGQERFLDLSSKYVTAKIKNARMPKSVKSDPNLEKSMLAATQSMLEELGKTGKAIRAVITTKDWVIIRNEITGIITHRTIEGAVAVTTTDGPCRYYIMRFAQDYNGKTYGKTRWDSHDDGTDIDCESAKK
jgi:hypothetical protein